MELGNLTGESRMVLLLIVTLLNVVELTCERRTPDVVVVVAIDGLNPISPYGHFSTVFPCRRQQSGGGPSPGSDIQAVSCCRQSLIFPRNKHKWLLVKSGCCLHSLIAGHVLNAPQGAYSSLIP